MGFGWRAGRVRWSKRWNRRDEVAKSQRGQVTFGVHHRADGWGVLEILEIGEGPGQADILESHPHTQSSVEG